MDLLRITLWMACGKRKAGHYVPEAESLEGFSGQSRSRPCGVTPVWPCLFSDYLRLTLGENPVPCSFFENETESNPERLRERQMLVDDEYNR